MEVAVMALFLFLAYMLGYASGESDYKKYLADKAKGKGTSKSFKVKNEWLAVTTETEYVELEIGFYQNLQRTKEQGEN